MPRQKISAKYTSDSGEHYMGIPARDLNEEEFEALSDDQKALLAASSFYRLSSEADEEAEAAARRAERHDEVAPMEAQAVAAMPEPPAPKDEPKASRK